MHTTKVETPDGVWQVHHNSDWSGDAILCGPSGKEVSIPGAVLLRIGESAAKEHVVDRIIAFAESL